MPIEEVRADGGFEECIDGLPCRVPGTVCVVGHCVQRDTQRTCGGETCPADAACCWRGGQCFECADRRACAAAPGAVVQECQSSRDCPAPLRCGGVVESDAVLSGSYYLGSSVGP